MSRDIELIVLTALLGLLATSIAYASVFTYYPLSTSIAPTPPPVVLVQTNDTLVCTGLARSRVALYYTDFESYPVPGWTDRGGTWSSQTGYKGSSVQGSDNDGGIGGASQYYYNTNLTSYSSLWASLKTKLDSRRGYYGFALINSGLNQLYRVSINTRGTIDVWSYNVTSSSWSRLARATITGYNSANWYVIVLNYVVSNTAVNFYVWVYDTNGNQVAYVTASSTSTNRFNPAYIGLEVDGPTAWFDDFIISTGDPRSLLFSGLPGAGYGIEVVDNLGIVVNSTVSYSASASLGVVPDIVVGTGTDGRINIYRPSGYGCLSYASPDSILGGDSYTLSTGSVASSVGPNSTSATASVPVSGSGTTASHALALRISNADAKPYYARLILDSSSTISASLTLNVTISLSPTESASPPIQIVSGAPTTWATGWVTISPGQTAYIYLSGYHSSAPSSSTLSLLLQYCSAPDEMGACVYYPVTLNVYS
ncbi:MAG: hypothetical protein GU361_02040 [Desulfurococcales archaeon]|jgi:hypothetical protein|nr:hypothetical protein [Desulfurococcales archaeon]